MHTWPLYVVLSFSIVSWLCYVMSEQRGRLHVALVALSTTAITATFLIAGRPLWAALSTVPLCWAILVYFSGRLSSAEVAEIHKELEAIERDILL